MSPRVVKGKLKNGREATTSPRRDEREKLMPPQLVVCETSEFQVLEKIVRWRCRNIFASWL